MVSATALLAGVILTGAGTWGAAPASARYASGGSGLYQGSIDWFEWGAAGQTISNGAVTNTRTVAGAQLATTCVISNLSGQAEAYRSGTWQGDGLDNLYNIGGTGAGNQLTSGIATRTNGTIVSFDFNCSATLAGAPVPLQGLVIADAEASNANRQTEYVEARPNSAATWRVIDRYRAPGCSSATLAVVSADGKLRFQPSGDECNYVVSGGDGPTAVGFMEGATGASVALKGGGKSAIALGVVLSTDFGDAPASYGEAGAIISPSWSGGQVGVGSTNVFTNFTLGVPGQPALRLGATVDSEVTGRHSADATGDDADGARSDEDAITPPGTIHVAPGETYTLSGVETHGAGFVAGWVDWNRNGIFDAGERSDVVPSGGPVDLTWTVPLDAVASVDQPTFLRLRVADTAAGASSPTGMTGAGEVEDWALRVALPTLALEKTSDGGVDSRVGDTVTYTVRATNVGAAPFTAAYPAVVVDDLSRVLDDAAYNADAVADRPGDLSYGSSLLTWSGPLAPGETVELTYTVDLRPGGDGVVRNVAWQPADPADPQAPACAPVVDGADATTGEPCAAVEYLLPRLTIAKVGEQDELPAVGAEGSFLVTVTNVGPGDFTAERPASYTDDLTDVLDDAEGIVVVPDEGVDVDGARVTWSGPLAAGESIDHRYLLTYTGEGNQILRNTACLPADDVAPGAARCDVAQTPGAGLVQWKEVRASASPVTTGTTLTYTLHFKNDGRATATVDSVDDLRHVVDDADVTTEPVATGGLTATRAGDRIAITGSLAPGASASVTYAVTLRPDAERGDDVVANYLLTAGDTPPTEPVCEPSDALFPDCTLTPVGRLATAKSVVADSAPVEDGSVLRYTLTFTNEGRGPVTVDQTDHLADVLDDADLTSAPVASDPALTVSEVTGGAFTVTGELAAGQVVTVDYAVTVKAQDERGDDVAANFLVPSGERPPAECTGVTCTVTPLPRIGATKTSDPASGTTVVAGQEVTYTLTFTNDGDGAGTVDAVDDLTEVLDDAELTGDVVVSDPALSADLDDGALHVTGTLAGGQEVTVTYTVTVLADGERGDNRLANVLAPAGVTDPDCADERVSCTDHPVPLLDSWKSVEAGTTPVTAGTELTYTLSFRNTGAAAASVDAVDDLTHVLDDATVTAEPVAGTGLTAVREGERIAVTGTVEPGTTSTVTYTVTVRPDGERGDDLAANYLLHPADTPPAEPTCTPGDLPDCTLTPIGSLVTAKAVAAGSTPVEEGTVLSYTLLFDGRGEGPVTVDHTDVLAGVLDDAELTSAPVSSDPALTVSDVVDGRFTVTGELPGGAMATVAYTVTVKPQSERGDDLAANFLVPTGEEPPAECVDGSCTVTALPRISATKSADPVSGETVVAGQEVTYTLTFANTGDGAGSVDHTDLLAGVLDDADLVDGPTVEGEGLTATVTGQTLRVVGRLAPGTEVTVSYPVAVKADGERGDNLLANVLAPTGADDPDCGDELVSCTEHPVPLLDTWKQVEADTTPVAAGTVLAYTLYFENTGRAPAVIDHVDLLDHVTDDADVTSEPQADEHLAVTRDGDRIAVTGAVPAGEVRTVTYAVTVRPDGERGDDLAANYLLENDADTPPTAPEEPECAPESPGRPECTLTPIGRLLTAKTVEASSSPVEEGTVLTYTLTFDNQGRGPITVDHTDLLAGVLDDADLTSAPVASDAALTVSDVAGDAFAVTGELAAGQTVTVTYAVTVKDQAERGDDSAANFLVPTGEEPPAECVDGSCTVTPLPRIGATKSADPASGETVVAGQEVTYSLVFANTGDGAGTVDFTDHLAEVLDDAVLTGAPEVSDEALTAATGADETIRVTGVLAPGQEVTVSYTVTVKADGERGDNLLRNAVVETGEEPTAECAADSGACTEHPVPLVGAWKQVEADTAPVAEGTVLTYTLFFDNTGQATGQARYVDLLEHVLDDADVTSEPTSPDGLTAVREGDRITVTGDVPVGEIRTVTYQVTVRPDGERGDDLAANYLLVDDADTPPTAPEEPTCRPDADRGDCTLTPVGRLLAWKSVSADSTPVEEGSVLTYTLTFDNQGRGPITVDHTDLLAGVLDDAELTSAPVASDAALTVSDVTDGAFTVTGELAAGQTVTVTYEATVKAQAERGDDVAANFLVRTGEEPPAECVEGDLACTVTPLPRIGATKSADPATGTTVVAGDHVTYTLTFANTGDGAGTVDHTDHLAGVLDDAVLTDGPTSSDDALTATSGADGAVRVTGVLEAGQEVTVSYTVHVKPDGERGDNVLRNAVVETGEEPPAECAADAATCTEHPVPHLVDAKTVDPASGTPVVAGQQLTYTLTFRNIGAAPGVVDRVDDLTHVLDDATVVAEPVASDDALAVERDGSRIAVTGELEPGATVTVTYTVEVNPTGERGDDILANVVLDPEDEVSAEPVCEGGEHCTLNPVGDIAPAKSVDVGSGSVVEEGQVLTYTLSFRNTGQGAAALEYTDHLADVLDDAEWLGNVEASDGLVVTGPNDAALTVTGTVAAGETSTVTYQVKLRTYAEQGNHALVNHLVPAGQLPSSQCGEANPLCTANPVVTPTPDRPGLAQSGVESRATLVAVGFLLVLGTALLGGARRRRAVRVTR